MTSCDLLAMLLVVQHRMLLAFTAGMHWYLIRLRKEQGEQMQQLYIGLSENFNVREPTKVFSWTCIGSFLPRQDGDGHSINVTNG